MENYSNQFIQGHQNARLCMSDLMFGVNPYVENSLEYTQWEFGFLYAFHVGQI